MLRHLLWFLLALPLWAKSDGHTVVASPRCEAVADLRDEALLLPEDMPMDELNSRSSAYIATRFHDQTFHKLVGRGATSRAYLIGKNIVLMPATGDLRRTQKEYRKVVRIYDLINELPPEKRRAFPELVDAHTYVDAKNSRDMLSLTFERANRGTLAEKLQDPKLAGPYAEFATLVRSGLMITDAIATLNSLNDPNVPAKQGVFPLSHGDIKPENLLVTNRGQGQEILVSDVGSSDPDDVHGTALYLPIKSSPFKPKILKPIELDAWALRKVLQELLMGALIRNLPPENVVTGDLTDQFIAYEGRELKKSPHSLNRRIPPTLSAISWAPDPSPASLATSLRKAAEYEKSPGRFFSEYFGPQVLMKLPTPQLAATIYYADELKSKFDPKDLDASAARLGLTPTMMAIIATRMLEFERAENPGPAKMTPANPHAPTQIHVPAAPLR